MLGVRPRSGWTPFYFCQPDPIGSKGDERAMKNQNRKLQLRRPLQVTAEAKNLMQERHCDHVVEEISVAAEAVIRASRQQVSNESGTRGGVSFFVP
jgi:hypothetical protein